MQGDCRTSRLAGLLYLIVVVTGIFSLAYVPSKLALGGETHVALHNILESETLFRLGMAGFLAMQVAFLLLPLALYRLLSPISRDAAMLMVALAVISVPVGLVALSHRLEALALLTQAQHAAVMPAETLQAQAQRALGEYHSVLFMARLFWGLWLLPFGYLVFRSGFLPRTLGVFLILGSCGYVIEVMGGLLSPDFGESAVSPWLSRPAAIGEIGTALWLLFLGAKPSGSST